MGYCITQIDSGFHIPLENHKDALLAIIKLHHQTWPGLLGSKKKPYIADFPFVNGKKIIKAKTLEKALKEWRWELYNDCNEIHFTGQKIGEDKQLFSTLAPFIKDGSYIVMVGEDAKIWRWHFISGKLKKAS